MSTNKKLGLLTASLSTSLVLAILSVGMIGGWFTGASVAETATVSLTVAGTASVSVTDSTVALGSLFYDPTCTNGVGNLSTFGYHLFGGNSSFCLRNSSNMQYQNITEYHVIQNNGTTTLKINATNDQSNATSFFCPTMRCPENSLRAEVIIEAISGENTALESSCGDNSALQSSSIESTILRGYGDNMDLKSQPYLCTQLGYQDNADTLNVSFRLGIPADADQGSKTLTLTYTGTAN